MKPWDAATLAAKHQSLASFGQLMVDARASSGTPDIRVQGHQQVVDAVTFIRDLALDHDFGTIVGLAEDYLIELNKLSPTPTGNVVLSNLALIQLLPRNDSLVRSFEPSFRRRTIMALSVSGHQLYASNAPAFGASVASKFPAAAADILEAAKCLAFRRNTAVVFHLMRAMEIAVRALADHIGATVTNSGGVFLTWGVIAQNINDKIKTLPLTDQPARRRAHAMLVSVLHAWRNPTMHPADTYDDDEADAVWTAARNFMKQLAELL